MHTKEATTDLSTLKTLLLCDTYWALNDQRADLDRRITAHHLDDTSQDILWQELEIVLAHLRSVAIKLARTSATQVPALCAKAAVLAKLLRSEDRGDDSIILTDHRLALALSLTTDIAKLFES